MTITARMLTQDKDGIGGYLAHPDGAGARPGIMMVHHAHGVTADYKIDAYRLAGLGFNVFVPSLFNRSEEHTSELQSRLHLVCRLLLEKKKLRMRVQDWLS